MADKLEELENKFDALESMFLHWMKEDVGKLNTRLNALEHTLVEVDQRVAANKALESRVAANEKRDSLTNKYFTPDGSVVPSGDTTEEDDGSEEDEGSDNSDDDGEDTVQRSNSLKTFNHSTNQLKI